MKKLLFVLALLCGSAFAQGSFYQLQQPLPNATLRVCPLGAVNPCPSPSSIFSDSGLTQPVTQPVQLGPSGNFGFWVASGQYLVQVAQPYNLSFVISLGGGGGLPTGLSFTSPTLTISSAGNGNGCVALSGNTSGASTICAPAVAGTATNPFTLSNTILLPAATSASAPGIQFASAAQGIFAPAASTIGIVTGNNQNTYQFTPTAFTFFFSKGQHFNTQAAANDLTGTCTLSSGSCTITFTTAYTSAPACVAVPSTTGTFTTGATLKVAPTTSSVVFTSTTGTDSAVIDYICMGNPN